MPHIFFVIHTPARVFITSPSHIRRGFTRGSKESSASHLLCFRRIKIKKMVEGAGYKSINIHWSFSFTHGSSDWQVKITQVQVKHLTELSSAEYISSVLQPLHITNYTKPLIPHFQGKNVLFVSALSVAKTLSENSLGLEIKYQKEGVGLLF